MIGYKISAEQASYMKGKHLNDSTTFNPKEDINGDWFVFGGEVGDFVTVEEFFWVKELTPSEYVPPINNEI